MVTRGRLARGQSIRRAGLATASFVDRASLWVISIDSVQELSTGNHFGFHGLHFLKCRFQRPLVYLVLLFLPMPTIFLVNGTSGGHRHGETTYPGVKHAGFTECFHFVCSLY